MRKAKQKVKTLKEEKSNREIIDGLNQFGLHPNKEGKSNTEVVQEIEEAGLIGSYEPEDTAQVTGFTKKWSKYRIDDKILAILFMEAFQQDHKGKMTPKFAYVSKLFGYPNVTLQDWWSKRKDLLKQKNLVLDKGFDYVQVKLMMTLMRMSESMTKIAFDEMVKGGPNDMKNFISMLNVVINKIRLMSNLSTNNVEHQHKHNGGVQMIIPD